VYYFDFIEIKMATLRNKISIATQYGPCEFVSFHDLDEKNEHFAIIFNNAHQQDYPLVRIHSECITGDLFRSCHCDCGAQLQEALTLFSNKGGILLYLRQEGRGIGLYNKLDAYALQQQGLDTFQANNVLQFPDDLRDFQCAAKMLKALNTTHIDLLTNNPQKLQQLRQHAITVRTQITTGYYLTKSNKNYLKAKKVKAGHLFNFSK
jgi:GTP cyclohydrolase II